MHDACSHTVPFDYEAPPSKDVPAQMSRFLDWFNETSPGRGVAAPIDGLARAALAHLWFESIHPLVAC